MEWVSKRERLIVCLYGLGIFLLSLLLLSVPLRAFAANAPTVSSVAAPGTPAGPTLLGARASQR